MYKYTFKDVFIHIFYKSEMLTLIVLGGVFYPNIIRVNYNEFDYFLSPMRFKQYCGVERLPRLRAGWCPARDSNTIRAGWCPGRGIATL